MKDAINTKEIAEGSSQRFKDSLKNFLKASFYLPIQLKSTREKYSTHRVFLYQDVEKMLNLFAKELKRARR